MSDAPYDLLLHSQWPSDIVTVPSEMSIIGFAVEYRAHSSNANKNQLQIDLSTAQCQRKAVGLPDRIVYGATCWKGEFNIYASWWNTGTRITFGQMHGTLNLNEPVDVLRCFCFLRNLQRYLLSDLITELQALEPTVAARRLKTFRWRMEDRHWNTEAARNQRRTDDGGADNRASDGEDGKLDGMSFSEGMIEEEMDGLSEHELDMWTAASEGYKREAAEALAELGGRPSPLDSIKARLPTVQSLPHASGLLGFHD